MDDASSIKKTHERPRNPLAAAIDLVKTFKGNGSTLHDKSPTGWRYTRKDLAEELDERLHGKTFPRFPYQGGTSCCGPAAFLYCLLKDRPDWYVHFALGLWNYGEFDLGNKNNGHKYLVKPSKNTIEEIANFKEHKITKLDWMTLASLHTGVTTPDFVRHWFHAVGAPCFSSTFTNPVTDYLRHENYKHFRETMKFYRHRWVILEINPSIMKGVAFSFWARSFGRHWVVVNKNKQQGERQIHRANQRNELQMIQIEMTVVTWGEENYTFGIGTPVPEFINSLFGSAAFGHVP